MKGQAFIIFRDVTSSTNAKAALDNAMLFGKPMRVNFSKNTSDIIMKSSGNISHKDKIKLDAERRKRREIEYQEIRAGKTGGQKRQTPLETRNAPVLETPSQVIPNNVLFVEGLPPDMTEPLLRTVFSKYSGFREVRLFAGKGIAFVEYDSEVTAGGALLGLNGLNLTSDCVLKISFAKK
jgi:RNA recognition motif-containing protein